MQSAGNLLATTLTVQPGVLGPPPLRPYANTSGGVLPSLPKQKGQNPLPSMRTLSRTKSVGRLARSVEMMTQRPVIGSFLSSGNYSPTSPIDCRKNNSFVVPVAT